MAVGGSNLMRLKDKNKLKQLEGRLSRAQSRLDKSGGDSNKKKVFTNQVKGFKGDISALKKSFGISTNTGPLKINNRGMTPSRTLAKSEEKIRSSQMNKGMAPSSANPEVKKKKARRNAAGTMGQMAYGGKVKKMMGGGMAKKYKHGGKVKKCKIDGIARKGKTRAARKK
tara:strand:- start:87 stop:596 length:510 start_codon:yes stop_codon:yes gene_type:complete